MVIDELILLTEVRLEVLRTLGRLSVAGALEMLAEISADLRAASAPQPEVLLPTEPPPVSPAYWEERRAIVPPPLVEGVLEEQMVPATPSATMAPDSESQPPREVALAPSGIAQAKAG